MIRAVTASTDPGVLGSDLASSHCYSVVAIDAAACTVTLRNPWGTDDDAFLQGADDGYMTISVDQFDDDMFLIGYAI